jgi:hypothetical protein
MLKKSASDVLANGGLSRFPDSLVRKSLLRRLFSYTNR